MKGQTENLHPDLADVIQKLEKSLGFEVTVTSGKRDEAHNTEVGGVPDSEHTYELAEGADVLCLQSVTRFKMVQWLLDHGIRRIGIGQTFVHIGIADDKPQSVLWHYYPSKD